MTIHSFFKIHHKSTPQRYLHNSKYLHPISTPYHAQTPPSQYNAYYVMKRTLLLIASVFIAIGAMAQINYPIGGGIADAKCSHADRFYGGVTLRNTHSGNLQVVSFNQGITKENKSNYNVYNNCANSEQYFTIKAGATVKPGYVASWDGAWMNSYVFLDKDRNFEFESVDLVSTTGLAGSSNWLAEAPIFTAPTTAGTYYMRYKIDWDDNSPTNLKDLGEGDMMTDVKLVVENLNVSTEYNSEYGTVEITHAPTVCGEDLTFTVTPKANCIITSIKVRCGEGLNGNQTKDIAGLPVGLQYVPSASNVEMWKETPLNVNGTTYTFPGASVQGDLKIIVEFKEITLTSRNYYRIKNRAYGTYLFSAIADKSATGGEAYVQAGDKALFHGAIDYSDASQIWKIEEYSDGTKYVSCQGLYLAPINTTDDAISLLQEEPANMQVTEINDHFVIGNPGASTTASNNVPFLHATNAVSDNKFPETTIGKYVTHWSATESASQWIFEEAATIDITIGKGGYSTLNFDFPVKLAGASADKVGLVGYITGTDDGTTIEMFDAVYGGFEDGTEIVPANTPIIVNGTENATYTLQILNEEVSNHPNQSYLDYNTLSGTLMPLSFEDGHGKNIYGIATVNGETKFYKMTSGATTIGKNKAYYDTTTTGVSKFDIRFGETITNINNAVNEENVLDKVYYDLNGRRVFYPTRGIYVTGSGKKVFVK